MNSSRIEGVNSSIRRVSLALEGADGPVGAVEAARNVRSLSQALENPDKAITESSIVSDHQLIMQDQRVAGKIRSKPKDVNRVGETIYLMRIMYLHTQNGFQPCSETGLSLLLVLTSP